VLFLLFLAAVAVLFYRGTKPDERAKIARLALKRGRELQAATRRPEIDRFQADLYARGGKPIVTLALVAANAVVFVLMVLGPGALADPATLLRWGASFGPRTTNGEWWRLVTSTFVNAGLVGVAINMVALAQVGSVMERLVGRLAFAAVYLAAGLLAALVNLSLNPVVVTGGASAAVYGIYGLLAAWVVADCVGRASLSIPFRGLQRLAPAALVFIIYNVAAGTLGSGAELAGFVTGAAYGLAVAFRAGDAAPLRRLAAASAATIAIAIAAAVPLRGMTDVRPELARIVALEAETSGAYQHTVDHARNHQIDTVALIALINKSILPQLRAARARIEALDRVPQEHRPLVAAASDYLKLREESWRLRAEGLKKTDMLKLRRSEQAERESFDALDKIKTTDQP